MEQMTTREQVLKSIRDAQVEGKVHYIARDVDFEQPIYNKIKTEMDNSDELAIHFAKKLDASEGFFIFCENDDELIESIKKVIIERNLSPIFTNDPKIELLFMQTGISYVNQQDDVLKSRVVVSFCDCLVARYGAVVLSSKLSCGSAGNSFPDVRFVIAFSNQIVENVADVKTILEKKYGDDKPSITTFISGPSCSNAIEQKPIIGVHGIRELYVFYLNDNMK